MLGLETWELAVALVIIFAGTLVQGTVGLGLGMLGAPLLAMIDHEFVPVSVLLPVVPLSVTMAWRERHHVDRRGILWALIGRLPGTMLGALLVARADGTALKLVIGTVVLLAVGASLAGVRFAPTDRNLAIAGLASGFTGTAAGIGGPPMALTYQHGDPATIRSTLAVYFMFGLTLSFISLSIGGVITERQLRLGAALLPASVLGTFIAPALARRLPADKVRTAVLGLCAVSATILVLEELI